MIDLNTATAEQLDSVAELNGKGSRSSDTRRSEAFHALRQLNEVPGLVGKSDCAGTKLSVG